VTELSFLIELLLNHKLPKATQLVIRDRIKEVETQPPVSHTLRVAPANGPPQAVPAHMQANPIVASQSPSMQAIMARNTDLIPGSPANAPQELSAGVIPAAPPTAPAPVAVIAQTPQAAIAMQERNKAIMDGINGPKKGQVSPRKW